MDSLFSALAQDRYADAWNIAQRLARDSGSAEEAVLRVAGRAVGDPFSEAWEALDELGSTITEIAIRRGAEDPEFWREVSRVLSDAGITVAAAVLDEVADGLGR